MGASAKGNPMFLSLGDSKIDDIEQGSTTTTPESPADIVASLGPRRDRRSHGGGSSSSISGSNSRGGEPVSLCDKRLPLPTPNPSTPKDDGSGGGLGDRAPFDSTSSGGAVGGGGGVRHSSSAPRVGSAPATTTRPTLGRRHHAPDQRGGKNVVGSSSSSRGHPDPRSTGAVDGGSRGRTRHKADGREAEDGGVEGGGGNGNDGRHSSRSGSRSGSRDRNAGGSRHLDRSRNGGSNRKLDGSRNGSSRIRPDRAAGEGEEEETEAGENAFSDFSRMVVEGRRRHGRGGSLRGGAGGGVGGGKTSRGSGSVGGRNTSSRGKGLVGSVGGSSSSKSLGGRGSGSDSGPIAYTSGQEPALKSHGCMSTATAMKLVTLLFALYNVSILWTRHYHPLEGRLCSFGDSRACVTAPVSKALLTVARASAGALFPSIAFCILSKCYASRYFLHHSWLALIIDFEPTHKLHTYFGVLALLCSVVHSACHIARSAYENNAAWLLKDRMSRSGLVALLLLLVSAMPMSIGLLRNRLTYEFRKLLHLVFIPFMVAVCFHGGPLRILGAVLLAWYIADRLYFTTRMTFLVSSPIYKSVGRGTLVRFDLPTGYQYKPGAYVQVNCPAISAGEWHPFSLFPVPGPRQRAGFHVEAVGDWTDELFRLCLENPQMPLWITAAQPSVVEQTVYYDNVVLVCTGAGITPAVSVAERFAKKKNVHLLWLSRDAGMIAMFEKQLRRVKSSVYLTGNPPDKTRRRMVDLLAPSKGDVVATTIGAAPAPPLSSKPNSRSSSYRSDLEALEDGGGGGVLAASASQASIEGYRGVLKDDDDGDIDIDVDADEGSSGRTEGVTEYGGDDDLEGSLMLGGSVWGGASSIAGGRGGGGGGDSLLGGGGAVGGSLLGGADSALGASDGRAGARKKHHRRRSSTSQLQRARGYHPVAVNFGRPDIEKFISETIQGTAIQAEWAPAGAARPAPARPPTPIAEEPNRASGLRQMLKRLNTGQRISKRDLMEADLSVVDAKPAKPAKPSSGAVTGFDELSPADLGQEKAGVPPVDMSSWLVLYCGSNASVERAVANACDGLKVTWRKEYFSKW